MIDINCDMGEGISNEELLMPYIDSANIACGFHAGNEETIKKIISLCLQFNVNIGAHPSFPDKKNFGRSEIQLPDSEIYYLIQTQLQIVQKAALNAGAKLHHVKLHGALYNMAARNKTIAHAAAKAVKDFDDSLVYFGLSDSVMITEAAKLGLQTANEVFADRTYQRDGSLTPRNQPNALINNASDVVKQVIKFVKKNMVTTLTGEEIFIKAETICIHGDGKHAVEFAKAIYQSINEK